jgi:hypothetical protein
MSLGKRARIAGFVLVLAGLTQVAYAQRGRWLLLGTAHVDGQADHDNISVGIRDGRFRAVQLRVKGAAIEFMRVVIHYGDGEPEEIAVRDRIPAGGQTREIDLRGRDRYIRSVELWYARGSRDSRRPEVRLFGMR